MQRMDIFTAIELRSFDDIERILKEKLEDPNDIDTKGRTPLMHMAMEWRDNDDRIIKLLLLNGANVNATDFEGGMALHHAARSGNFDFIDTLRDVAEQEVFYHVPDYAGQTPVDIALKRDDERVLVSMSLGRFKRLNLNHRETRLAIVGVGPAGASLFISLVNKLLKWREKKPDFKLASVYIFLLDRHRHLGTGTPYSPEQNSPTSLLNVAAGGMSIDASNSMDFVEWIDEKAKIGKLAGLLGSAHRHGLCVARADPTAFYPRTFYGLYVAERLLQYMELAKEVGINVWGANECSVVEEGRSEGGLIRLGVTGPKINGTTFLDCTNVYYATGHWEEESARPRPYESSAKYIAFPANIKRLEAAGLYERPANIAVLGSSLSAIDAIYSVLLHSSVGRLEWRDGVPTYLRRDDTWKVTCYSRRGLMSRVRPLESRNWRLQHLTPENIAKKRLSNRGPVTLDQVIALLNREFSEILGRAIDVVDESDPLNTSIKLKDNKNPFRVLQRDLERALESRQGPEAYVVWYQVMHALFPIIRIVYRQWSPDDRARFDREFNSRFLWAFAPMPYVSAQVLLAMHAAGALDVYRVNEEPTVSEGSICVRYLDERDVVRTGTHPFMIGTTGLASTFQRDKSELTQYLVNHGQLRFTDPAIPGPGKTEGSAFITDDGNYELLDSQSRHSPARRGVGFFIHAQLFDVQAVPGVVGYGDRVAALYADEIAFKQYRHFAYRKGTMARL